MLPLKARHGLLGEHLAARYLKEHDWDIHTVNYSCRYGEIDIIAQKDGFLVFFEVKTRSDGSIAEAKEWVDDFKQSRIVKTAALYMQRNPFDLQPRFDVIEVYLKDGKPEKLNHIESAFDSMM